MAFGRLLFVVSWALVFGLAPPAVAQGNPWRAPDYNRSNQYMPNQNQNWNGANLPYQSQYQPNRTLPANRQNIWLQNEQRPAAPPPTAYGWPQNGSRHYVAPQPPNGQRTSNFGTYRSSQTGAKEGNANGHGNSDLYGNGSRNSQPARSYPPPSYRPSQASTNTAPPRQTARDKAIATAPSLRAANSRQGQFVPSFAAGQFGPGARNRPAPALADYPPLNGDPASLNASRYRAGQQAAPQYNRAYGQGPSVPQAQPAQQWPQQYPNASPWGNSLAQPINPQWGALSRGFAGPSTFGNPYAGVIGTPYGSVLGGGILGGLGGYPLGAGPLSIY